MKFIDQAIIILKAGNGGNGIISFKREKNNPKGGPDGGDGGDGGSIFFQANKNINTLIDYTFKKFIQAQNGESGKNRNKSGKKGKNLTLFVPLGTKIINYNTNEIIKEFKYHKQSFLLLQGGWHGLGNYRFKSSTNRTPKKKTLGKIGETIKIKLELSLLADVGIIGLPNVGKSTFIRSISSAKPKIGNYYFTTLRPYLGVFFTKSKKSLTFADIPGIIKGASRGIGLGLKFLRHIEKCKILLHIIDLSIHNYKLIIKNINIVNKEIKLYKKKIYKKKKWLVFNKSDLIKKEDIKYKIKKILKKINYVEKYFIISAINKKGLNTLCKNLSKII
ncbi:Obg family GTPase CgtA [Buchnera aphidicola]|uniref:Obg family GTPase CgtA n=1 Tax=Buchnera aphidicola TaxID=9 RepID=UPI0022385DE3|nr:Obg family GTPase CgtA [Buchnera aphidicola]MCW5197573.1 Obg family GTPase CgtA [Buchnera aphidicola (Chaitophorus viminalis)]